MNTPLSRLTAPSPLSLRAARFGRGDNASSRRRSGNGVRWRGLLRGRWLGVVLPAAKPFVPASLGREGNASFLYGFGNGVRWTGLLRGLSIGLKTTLLIAACAVWTGASAQKPLESCDKPVYLTFDTGHMGIAPLVADVLARQHVRVTFFAANERTQQGDGSLGNTWAPWWKARAAEGHEFASHTWQHAYWRGDVRADGKSGEKNSGSGAEPRFRIEPSAGPQAGKRMIWSARQYCEDIALAADRLASVTGKKPLPLFRAPGGKTSPKLLAAAESCGYKYVGWSPAGFLGDELPSGPYPNDALLKKALADIRPGDILLAHLGIWSRQDPWAPAVLEPLITGLKARGFCFRTLREHPQYQGWIAQHGG